MTTGFKQQLTTNYSEALLAKALRQTSDKRLTPVYGFTNEGLHSIVELPYNYATLIKLSLTNEVLRTAIEALIREALRNQAEVKPKYICKCKDCGAEYQNLKEQCSTPECEGTDFLYPDYSQKQKIELLLKQPNNDNTVDQIDESLLRYMLSTDDHWLSYQKGVLTPEKIAPATVYIEDATCMRVVYKEKNGTIGNGEYFCPNCMLEHSTEAIEKGKACPHCGNTQLKETAYTYVEGTKIIVRFAKDEIYHGIAHPLLPGFYGNSLIVSALQILLSITAMDTFNYDNYSTGKLAQILVFMGLSQTEAEELAGSVKKQKDLLTSGVNGVQAAKLRTLFLGGRGNGAGEGGVEAVDAMPDSESMQSLDWWKLWREVINGLHGITDMAAGALQQGTTGQNPGKKMDINNNTVEFFQHKLEACWDWVFASLGVVDWVRRFKPVEEKDEAQDQAILMSKLMNIEKAISLGMEAELTDEQEVKISGKPLTLQEKQEQAMKQMQEQAKLNPQSSEQGADKPFEGKQAFKKENVFANEKGGKVKSKFIVTELKTE